MDYFAAAVGAVVALILAGGCLVLIGLAAVGISHLMGRKG